MSARRSVATFAVAISLAFALAGALPAGAAPDVPVPAHCNATVNAQLAELVTDGYPRERDNVMVCGTVTRDTYYQASRGRAGSHHVTAVQAPVATGGSLLVQIVTNDELDGVITAHTGDHIAAFGQFYQTTERQRPYAAGLHDTHCSTHRGADNGWVWINGNRWPKGACPF
jgi:hypothetical protein